MLRKSKLFTWCAITFTCMKLNAQDPKFSQFFANPIYLNPAFTGTNVCARLHLNIRDQWPAIQGAYAAYSASYDQQQRNTTYCFGDISLFFCCCLALWK